ncbi:MAG: hypothetical protein ABGY41_15025 [Candidatus Poribacteria bacterium]
MLRAGSIIACLTMAALLVGCGEDVQPNTGPNILVLLTEPEYPAPGEAVAIRFDVLDLDGDRLRLTWELSGGEVFVEDGKYFWRAPDEEGQHQITLRASDGQDVDSKTVDILVWQPREGNYYPLAVGNEWIYVDEDGETVTIQIVDTIQIEHDEITSYVLQTSTTDPHVPEGVVNFAYVGRIEDGIDQHAVNVIFGSGDTLIFDPWLPLYTWPLIPGKQWMTPFKARVQDGFFVGEGTASYRVIDESTLTTAAGTFENVFQIEETFKWTLFDQPLDTTVVRKWLAPNVGIVKIDQTQTRGEQTQRTTAEIVSYDLLPDTSFDDIPTADQAASPAL